MNNNQIQIMYDNNLKIQATLNTLVQLIDSDGIIDKLALVEIALDYANGNNDILQKAV
jgi:hypothetical protein